MGVAGTTAAVVLAAASACCAAADRSRKDAAGQPAAEGLAVDSSAVVDGPDWDAKKGVWRFSVRSPFQRKANPVEVLLPEEFDRRRKHRVLYVLPVEPGIGGRFGDGLLEVKKARAHDRHRLICVAPAFDTVPWYGAHATDNTIRHEAYLRKVVVPLIEARYPTCGTAEGRLLLGFSKSGWGALTLLFRGPEFFGFAASWDAPLMMTEAHFGTFETARHFGTAENFAGYLPSRLAETAARHFRGPARIVLLGRSAFGAAPGGKFKDAPHTATFHRRLEALGIRHVYDNGLKFRHDWRSGWVPRAVDLLVSAAESGGDLKRQAP